MNKSILIVDSSIEEASLLKAVLESTDFGYQCHMAQSFEQLGEIIGTQQIDVLLVDKEMMEDAFYRKLKKLKLENKSMRMILLAEHVEPKEMVKAQEHFIEGFCQKGDDYPALINTLEQVVD